MTALPHVPSPAVPVSPMPVEVPGASRPGWPRWQIFAFRYALLHYALYAFPGPFNALAQVVGMLSEAAGRDASEAPASWFVLPGEVTTTAWTWITTRMWQLGLAPWEVIHEETGSGDTGKDFAQLIFIVAASLLGASLWGVFGRAGAHPRLGRWAHLVIRCDLAFTSLTYGLVKLFGGQFGELSLDRLTQEIGDIWPMTLVGTFMQASRPYELFGGAAEVLGGLLLFHRRTALLGAVVTAGAMTNVCALNWFCGVPVKLFSTHLLLFSLGLLAPFVPQLVDVFVLNRPSTPVELRVLPASRAARGLAVLGTTWVAVFVFGLAWQGIHPPAWRAARERGPLYGLWSVESMRMDGQDVPERDATRWRDFAVDAGTRAWARELSGDRHEFEFAWDGTADTAQVKDLAGGGEAVSWTVEQGTRVVKREPRMPLRHEERDTPVDTELRSLVLRGRWRGHDLEVRTVEKLFRLKTGFRLRQELPDRW